MRVVDAADDGVQRLVAQVERLTFADVVELAASHHDHVPPGPKAEVIGLAEVVHHDGWLAPRGDGHAGGRADETVRTSLLRSVGGVVGGRDVAVVHQLAMPLAAVEQAEQGRHVEVDGALVVVGAGTEPAEHGRHFIVDDGDGAPLVGLVDEAVAHAGQCAARERELLDRRRAGAPGRGRMLVLRKEVVVDDNLEVY